MINLSSERLKTLLYSHLKEIGGSEEACFHVSESLIQTSLRGVDSHGINLFPHYARALEGGRITKNPSMQVEKELQSTILLNADHAFGHHSGSMAVSMAIEKAKKTGVGVVCVKDSSHFGAAAYFGLQAAEKDFIGIALTNADGLVNAYGSKDVFFGTNPICVCVPLANEEPLCLDMATSMVSWNKILNHRRSNTPIPEDWAFDDKGNRVTDPHQARSLSSIGLYKGYGLGMMVEMLCGVLAGGPIGTEIKGMYKAPLDVQRSISHFFIVLDVNSFIHIDDFKKRMQSIVNNIREMAPIDGVEKVMVPGDPEKEMYKKRIIEGIPIDETKFEEFLALSDKFKEAIIP